MSLFEDKQIVRDGQFVSERVAQVIEAIRDHFGTEIEVQWVPPSARTDNEAAFRVRHCPPGGEPYTIFHVKNENEFDTRVLMRLIHGDQRNGRVAYSDIEAAELAAKLVAKQRADDQMAETVDKMYSVLRSPLNTYRLDKDTVIKDGIPFNAKGY